MSALLAARRRQIHRKGRPMRLQRLVRGSATLARDVPLLGVAGTFRPEQMAAGVQQGDQVVEILDDALQAAGWTDRPRPPDRLIDDERSWTLVDAWPVHDGGLRIGWRLWVRGAA